MTGPQGARPTLKDVARLAGVGTMTASRVVTGKGYASPETRARVREAIAALGYVPNQHARGLRTSRSGLIALVVSDLTNPYFSLLARGAEEAARRQGALVIVADTSEDEAEELRCLELLLERGVDGVLLVPRQAGTEAAALAARRSLPLVVVDRRGPHGVDSIRCDSVQGAATLAELLAQQGHRRASVLAAAPGVSTSDDRVEGFVGAFQRAGGRSTLLRGELTVESGEAMAREAASLQPQPSCLFAVNNFLAIGALRALGELGLKVPADISVVGFDDLPSTMVAFPFLTVAHQPARELGALACARLLQRIQQPDLPPTEQVIPTTLILRSSVGKPGRFQP